MRFVEEMSGSDKFIFGFKVFIVFSLILHTIIFYSLEDYYEQSVPNYYLNLLDLYFNYFITGVMFLCINNYKRRKDFKELFKSDLNLKEKIKTFLKFNIDDKNYFGLAFLIVGLLGSSFVMIKILIRSLF